MPNRPAGRLLVLAFLLPTIALPRIASAVEGRLATPALQKAANACQALVAKVGAKVQAGKLAALDTCGTAAMACVQTKQADGTCFAKAGQACTKKLGAAAANLAKAKSKIVAAKSCAATLRLADLMSSDGLGYGALVGSCQVDFGLEVCGGIDPLAECLVRARDRAAGARYGEALPRTADLLALLPTALPAVSGLPIFPGCDACSVAPGGRKQVEQCGKAVTKAAQTLTAALEKAFSACGQKAFACAQAGSEACFGGAAQTCDKSEAKIGAAFGKLATAVGKKCAAGSIEFSELADTTGLNLAALGAVCPGAAASPDALAVCLQQRTACAAATESRRTFARLDELASNGRLGSIAPRLTASCPPLTMQSQALATRGPRTFFGSMTKFMKLVKLVRSGTVGSIVSGGRPATTPGIGRKVTSLNGPVRITLGGMTKVPFRYKIGGATKAAAATQAAEPPKLIVTVQRQDVVLDDHFEIELDPAPAVETEVEDELQIAYQNDIPGCAFTLALATKVDGVVSDDTTLLQAVDVPPPPPPGGPITQIASYLGDGAGHGLVGPIDVAVDGTGNVYAAGFSSNNVFKITPAGKITQIIDATGDGQGHTLNAPNSVAVDDLGNVYVVGQGSDNAFRITPGGAVSEIVDATGDGTHALDYPHFVTVDGSRNVYVSALGSANVFEITPAGTITQIIDATGDGAGHALGSAYGVAADDAGNVYVNGISSAFKIAGGTITQIIDATGDGAGNAFNGQGSIGVDGAGNVYAASSLNDRVFRITSAGTVSQIIGPDGDGAGHALQFPYGGLAVAAGGDVYVTGALSQNAFAVTAGGITQIIDATGDGKGNLLSVPTGIAVNGTTGTVYVGSGTGVFAIAPN